MSTTTENNKRIAKNTLLLYSRMILILLVNLYTSRIVLNALGIVDFGLYNVIGGIVIAFTFFASSLSNATQRFFNFQIGVGNIEKINNYFNISVRVYVMLSIIVFILLETIGVWFVETRLVIPDGRINAVEWVLHCSILTSIISLNGLVYSSLIISKENMEIYAYVGILEAIGKLIIAFLLFFADWDKLICYSILILFFNIIIQLIYFFYCRVKYVECRFTNYWNKYIFKEMFGFVGWNAFGSAIWVVNQQGINILLNIFFGPVINAARAIAFQVNSAITNFSVNFYTAVRPQIIKTYAKKEYNLFLQLVYSSSRYSFYLLWLLCLPILLNTETILILWLKNLPDVSSIFTKLVLVFALIDVLSNPLFTAAQATGKIKKYTIIGGLFFLTAFPLSYIFLLNGYSAYWVFISLILSRVFSLISVLFVLSTLINLNIVEYMKVVIKPIVVTVFMSFIIPFVVNMFLESGMLKLIIVTAISVFSVLISVYFYGLNMREKNMLLEKIKVIRLKYEKF